MTDLQKRHPFSYTIGEGGYKFVGTFDLGAAIRHQEIWGDTARAFADAPRLESGMGTCSHCGHAILTICIIRRGDGKLFGVGSDCVRKVAAEGDVGAISQMERELRAAEKKKRQARTARQIESLDADFHAALIKLDGQPHPNPYFAGQGKTAGDYFRFIPKNVKNMKAAIAKAEQQ